MKWLHLVLFIVALVYPVLGDHDYTGRYAELAAPVPSHVNVDDLVESLRSASQVSHVIKDNDQE